MWASDSVRCPFWCIYMSSIDIKKLKDDQLLDYCLYLSDDGKLKEAAGLLQYAVFGDAEKIASILHKVLFNGASLHTFYPAFDKEDSIAGMSYVGSIPDGSLYLSLGSKSL